MERIHGWSSDSQYDEDMYDLDTHNSEMHMSSTDNDDNSIACNFCENTFGNNAGLFTARMNIPANIVVNHMQTNQIFYATEKGSMENMSHPVTT